MISFMIYWLKVQPQSSVRYTLYWIFGSTRPAVNNIIELLTINSGRMWTMYLCILLIIWRWDLCPRKRVNNKQFKRKEKTYNPFSRGMAVVAEGQHHVEDE